MNNRADFEETTVRIGYACITIGVPGTSLRTCTRRYATEENLLSIIHHNLDVLEKQCDYNLSEGIYLFRISSDMIPFAGTSVNPVDWGKVFYERFRRIGEKIRAGGLRVSMHPGQYTVLNSPDQSVVGRAISDLEWHARFMDALDVSSEHKIILHVGGVYGDKTAAMKRFVHAFQRLETRTRERIAIENDERSYSIGDVLRLHEEIGAPVIYDNLHREVYEKRAIESHSELMDRCGRTWGAEDGRQKIHYSQQNPDKRKGAHSDTIRAQEFSEFFREIGSKDLDIMLEVKDKNLSAVKCQLLVRKDPDRKKLEREWARYKYWVMERSPHEYMAIRAMFRQNRPVDPFAFYLPTEKAIRLPIEPGHAENAALHIWGYFSERATGREKKVFFDRLNAYRSGKGSLSALKKHLFRLAERCGETYLLNSLYFYM